ncbi:MAG: hypothetical protein ING31_07980 [Burkholderiales bacterium]|nr:hypothetical protein [Burkholderiales bacterium]
MRQPASFSVFFIALSAIVFAAPVNAQDANPKPRREPLVVGAPPAAGSGTTSTAEACARQAREREKRRAQGLPVGPMSRTSPCRSLGAAERKEPPARKADTGLRQKPMQDAAGENRRRRIQQNTGSGDPPKLR